MTARVPYESMLPLRASLLEPDPRDSVLERVARRASWRDVLEVAGWTEAAFDAETDRRRLVPASPPVPVDCVCCGRPTTLTAEEAAVLREDGTEPLCDRCDDARTMRENRRGVPDGAR